MKKFLFLSLFSLLFLAGKSQVYTMTSQYGKITDTVTDGATKNLRSSTIAEYKTIVTVQLTATEISGTTDAVATLQGSLDGVNWYSMDVDSTRVLTDVASQVKVWHIYNIGDPYLRVSVTGTGTMASRISVKYIAR